MPHGALSPRFLYILLDGLAGRILGYFSFFSGDYDTFCGMDTPFTRWIFLMVFGFRSRLLLWYAHLFLPFFADWDNGGRRRLYDG